MSLAPGARLAGYEIVSVLGEGGMGQVYRARDAKLDRSVAIKVLPPGVAHDAERVARFEQEAKATSALNHPNILTVFDFGTHDGAPFIVSELLEGQDLRARLTEAPMPLRAVIDYARQMVSGLAAAHDKGIVHRDLKPENVFVTWDERVKLLDFGLAKLTGASGDRNISGDTTRRALTEPGMVLGTATYMSPEQVRGQEADHRSDIFSVGAILYEMIAGRRAFRQETVAETMAAILKEEPADLLRSRPDASPAVERIVRRCLEKKPERRFQSTADLGFAIESLAPPAGASGAGPATAAAAAVSATASDRWRARLPWLVAGTFAVVAVVASSWAARSGVTNAAPGTHATRLAFVPPPDLAFSDEGRDDAVIAPDGTKMAFTASTANGEDGLYVRALDSGETKLLPGTADAIEPFWSPDSRTIAFGAQGKLKRVDLAGGASQVLCDAARLTGGAWNRQGVIIFGSDYGSAIVQVPDSGAEPKPVTTIDAAHGDREHSRPWFLPDGRHFLFSRTVTNDATGAGLIGVWAGSLDSPEFKQILPDQTAAMYAPPGWIIFIRNQVLMAQAFDADRLQLGGDAVPIVGGAATGSGFRGFSVSDTGILVSNGAWQRQYQLEWLDRAGKQIGVLGDAAPVTTGEEPTISPDGRRVAFKRASNMWVCEISGRNCLRLTSTNSQLPVWSPDSRAIAFNATIPGSGVGIFRRAVNGSGATELLLAGTVFPKAWSPDGRFLLYLKRGARTRGDIWVLPRTGSGSPYPLLDSAFDEQSPEFSPDGHWLAYVSDESGGQEVYVRPFTVDGKIGGDTRRISTGGGLIPNWRRDGRELVYVTRDGRMMSVGVQQSGSSLEFGPPRPLFKVRMLYAASVFHEFDVAPDGQSFLVGTAIGDPKAPPPAVIVNWMAEVRR